MNNMIHGTELLNAKNDITTTCSELNHFHLITQLWLSTNTTLFFLEFTNNILTFRNR